ncbi:hypothetical protein BOW52_07845 [Solemya elarraichensis gill symbiont]|uniref:Uncharacterized protein n=1 Tax=Solemya elarraichensis gill symbiont TaxID=1918949 RepID=A0A1T2L1L3_9GAMM|nr:hypothetical protein BOW52_07845 [Solemya elarraichensis gill symbiont]
MATTRSANKETEGPVSPDFQTTGDEIWDKLMRLPYFNQASLERQGEIYEKEKEKGEQKREREKEDKERERE